MAILLRFRNVARSFPRPLLGCHPETLRGPTNKICLSLPASRLESGGARKRKHFSSDRKGHFSYAVLVVVASSSIVVGKQIRYRLGCNNVADAGKPVLGRSQSFTPGRYCTGATVRDKCCRPLSCSRAFTSFRHRYRNVV